MEILRAGNDKNQIGEVRVLHRVGSGGGPLAHLFEIAAVRQKAEESVLGNELLQATPWLARVAMQQLGFEAQACSDEMPLRKLSAQEQVQYRKYTPAARGRINRPAALVIAASRSPLAGSVSSKRGAALVLDFETAGLLVESWKGPKADPPSKADLLGKAELVRNYLNLDYVVVEGDKQDQARPLIDFFVPDNADEPLESLRGILSKSQVTKHKCRLIRNYPMEIPRASTDAEFAINAKNLDELFVQAERLPRESESSRFRNKYRWPS